MKITFFKKENSFKKKSSEINYFFYWSFIFYIGVSLTLLAFVFGFYFFREMNKEFTPVVGGVTEQVGTVKKERIGKVLEYFSDRKKKSTQILNSPAPISDPSL